MKTSADFPAVDGEVYPVSPVKTFLLVIVGLVFLFFGINFDWHWLKGEYVWLLDIKLTVWGALFGLAMILLGSFLPPYMLWKLFVQKECIIIGEKCFQIANMKRGRKIVKLQVPYEGIHSLRYANFYKARIIEIRMKTLRDPDFFHLYVNWIKMAERPAQPHFAIRSIYKIPQGKLYQKIITAIEVSGQSIS